MSKLSLILGRYGKKSERNNLKNLPSETKHMEKEVKSLYHLNNKNIKWVSRSPDEETLKMSNGKWLSQISNDSAFCSTENGHGDPTNQFDNVSIRDDHQMSDLSLDHYAESLTGNLHDKIQSDFAINISKSSEELSQSRLSNDGDSFSLPPLSGSVLSVCGPSSKRTSLENITCSSTPRKRTFKRSTSYESKEEPRSFRQKFFTLTKKTQPLIKEQVGRNVSPYSFSLSIEVLEQYDVWAPESFIYGKDIDFQVRPADPFFKIPEHGTGDSQDTFTGYVNDSTSKVALIRPVKSDAFDSVDSAHQKCIINGRVIMQNKPRHLFLFDTCLIITKQKYQAFRIKIRINLALLWLSHDDMQSNGYLSSQYSRTFGWAQKHINSVMVTFGSLPDLLTWINAIERQQNSTAKLFEEVEVIKVYYEDRNHDNRTKKIAVKRRETAAEVLKRVPNEFFPTTTKESQFQFCLKFVGDTERYYLTGCESLYSIQLASNNRWLGREVEYFSIAQAKSGSFINKSHSWRRTKQVAAETSPDLVVNNNATCGEAKYFECNMEQIFKCNNGEMSEVLLVLLQHLYRHGPSIVGIFRKCSSQREVQTALELMDKKDFIKEIDQIKISVASSVLKIWLKAMPDCLLVGENYFKWIEATEITDEMEKIHEIKKLVQELPKLNHMLLRHLICVLHHITSSSEVNKMTPFNIAVCLGPSILRPADFVDNETEADTRKMANVVIEILINHAEELFGRENCIDLFCIKDYTREEEDNDKNLKILSSTNNLTTLECPGTVTITVESFDELTKSVKQVDSGICDDKVDSIRNTRPKCDGVSKEEENEKDVTKESQEGIRVLALTDAVEPLEAPINGDNSLVTHTLQRSKASKHSSFLKSSKQENKTISRPQSFVTKEPSKRNSPAKIKRHRKHDTMPILYSFHNLSVIPQQPPASITIQNKSNNIDIGNPRYIVEVFIGPPNVNNEQNEQRQHQVRPIGHKEQCHHQTCATPAHNLCIIPIKRSSSKKDQPKFKTTIYLESDDKSSIRYSTNPHPENEITHLLDPSNNQQNRCPLLPQSSQKIIFY